VSHLHRVFRAVVEVAVPVISGILIIIVVFLPLFSLTGLEGKMFKPLAITISFALIGSLLLSLTVIPVLASLLVARRTQARLSAGNALGAGAPRPGGGRRDHSTHCRAVAVPIHR
jgi:Cu/Ag efflux pump CusA